MKVLVCPECDFLCEDGDTRRKMECKNRKCCKVIKPVWDDIPQSSLRALRAWSTRRCRTRIPFEVGKNEGILSEFATTNGKRGCYHLMLDAVPVLYPCGRITMFGLPGSGSWFETELSKVCKRDFVPLELYLIERKKALFEQVRENFRDWPNAFISNTNLSSGELSNSKFVGAGSTQKRDFGDLCRRTNFVWLDFMGPLSEDYKTTIRIILSSCKTANLLFCLTLGSRGKTKRETLDDSECVVEIAENKWRVDEPEILQYRSRGDIPMLFLLMVLSEKPTEKATKGVQ